MDLGFPLPNITPPTGKEGIERFARAAEDLGFHSLWLGDHLVKPIDLDYDGTPARYTWDLYEPFVSAGYAAAITSKPKIAFGVIVLPYRNPIVTAKMVATLDQLSGGRVILGVGPGYLAGEFRALGIPQRDTGARTDEYLALFRALWSSEQPEFHGRFVHFDRALFKPGPLQHHLPIWIGGFSDAALRRAARFGDGLHLPRFSVEGMRPYVERFREIAAEEGRDLSDFVLSNRPFVRFADRPVTGDDPRAPIIGPPDYVAEELARYETELGVTHLVLDLHEGDPIDDVLDAFELLAAKVAPQLPKPTIDISA